MKNCPLCGTTFGAGAKFCANCGVALSEHADKRSAAEQRQITVLFCDLVGSTQLSEHLGPEEYAYVLKEYQALMRTAVELFGGHVGQYLGDGILAYFGYPTAHEDAARRGILAGRAIQEAIGTRNARLDARGARLDVRVGIHAGVVVAGGTAIGSSKDDQPLGLVLNVASRVQAMAQPGTIVVTDTVRSLARGFFSFAELGVHQIRGVSGRMSLYQVMDEVTESRFHALAGRGLTPFVGRNEEVATLRQCWKETCAGTSGVVSIRGEPGIGKSRLTRLIAAEARQSGASVTDCECSPYHATTTLHPITDTLSRQIGVHSALTPDNRLDCLERFLATRNVELAQAVPLLAALLGIAAEARYAPLPMSSELQREETLKLLLNLAREAAKPHLIVIEDLQWADATTIELVKRLIEGRMPASTMLLVNFRPEFEPGWTIKGASRELDLDRLNEAELKALIGQVAADRSLPIAVAKAIADASDGIPLFAEEVTKSVLEAGAGMAQALTPTQVPSTLQDSLMARLDRLGSAKEIAQRAAVIGRRFQYSVLLSIADAPEGEVRGGLLRLIDAGLVFADKGASQDLYVFKHALVQVAAYESQLHRVRQELHRRIVTTLEDRFPATVVNEPELLAHHSQVGDLNDKAIYYWIAAGRSALARSANVEAVEHLTIGRALLSKIEDPDDRRRHELRLLTLLGRALIANRGFAAPEVGEVFARGRVLCDATPANPETFLVLSGLCAFFHTRGELEQSRRCAGQMLELSKITRNDHFLMRSRSSLGISLYWLGDLDGARRELEAAAALYDPARHSSHTLLFGTDPGVTAQCYLTLTYWMLGRPDEAEAALEAAVRIAEPLNHPFTSAWPKAYRTVLHSYRNEPQQALAAAQDLVAFSREQQQQYWLASGIILSGWGMTFAGKLDEGIAQMQAGISAYAATGARTSLPNFHALLAEVLLTAGRLDEAQATLDTAFAAVQANNQRVSEIALWRIKGALLEARHPDDLAEAIECYRRAVDLPRAAAVIAPRLRAATALHKVLARQGSNAVRDTALARLVAMYPANAKTPDLQAARSLLASSDKRRSQ